MMNQRARTDDLGELLNARAASTPSNAYSRKCAALRTMKCRNTSVSSDAFGNNHFNNGPTIVEVFEAEKLADEANDMNAIQARRGKYLLTTPGCER